MVAGGRAAVVWRGGAGDGAAGSWADESHALGRGEAYGARAASKGADVGRAYSELTWRIMQLRIEQAGVRLAAVLNTALDNG